MIAPGPAISAPILLLAVAGLAPGQSIGVDADNGAGGHTSLRANESRAIESTMANASHATSALRRLVRCIDFDEPDQGPYILPPHFFRVLTRDGGPPGFPDFGSIAIANDQACSGDSSLRFELEAGSMAAAIAPGIINVLPRCDYAVTAKLRTRGLHHARLCIVATFHDDRGHAIPTSRRRSQPLLTNDQWHAVTIAMPGEFAEAASLVLELQLLQPRQYLGADLNGDQPVLEDVRGTAWIDDVMIWQTPRVLLRTSAPGNVIRPDEPRRLELELRDASSSPLIGDLHVEDLDGRTVFHHRFEEDINQDRHQVDLPASLAHGWYRALVTLRDEHGRAARQPLQFVLAPRVEAGIFDNSRAGNHDGDSAFGIAIEHCQPDTLASLPDLLRRCGARAVILPVWTPHDRGPRTSIDPALPSAIDRMRDDGVSVTLSLFPPWLGVDSASMLELAMRDPRSGRTPIEQMLLELDHSVSTWVIGPMNSAFDANNPDFDRVADNVSAAFGRLMARPQLHFACSIERQPAPARENRVPLFLVPGHIQPASILEEIERLHAANTRGPVLIEQPPEGLNSPRERVIDTMLRGLYAWRSGTGTIFIRQPWRMVSSEWQKVPELGGGSYGARPGESAVRLDFAPDPSLPVWRTLADQLRGRSFLAELPLADGAHCWIVSARHDSAGRKGMLIAWNEQAPHQPAQICLPLALHDVEVTDAFGNCRPAAPRHDGRHDIALSETPIFIDGIDLEPALFRARLALDEPFIPSMHRAHERRIVLHNPWSMPMTGSIRLHAPEGWTITPDRSDFAVHPGGNVGVPISIVPARSVFNGRSTIIADITLRADRVHAFSVPINVDVGLEEFTAATTWATAPLQSKQVDLLVRQVVTNRSDRILTLDLSIIGEAISLKRLTIADLAPGETAQRTIRIENGAALLAGKDLRIAVAERGGLARLNETLAIPAMAPAPRHAQQHNTR